MTNSAAVPFSQIAAYYDLLYQDKDYPKEATFVDELIEKILPEKKRKARILDLACGTGRHAMELTRLGYSVEGSDLSAEMIAVARRESALKNLKLPFYNESFQTCRNIQKKYDVLLALFASIDYLVLKEDLSLALNNIFSLLEDGGIFIFDFWNGNAVLNQFSPVRTKRVERDGQTLIRTSHTTVDAARQTATMRFIFSLEQNSRTAEVFSEEHEVRYFFPQEITSLLNAHHFESVLACPFLGPIDSGLSEDNPPWNVTVVARKRGTE